jgi:hypothetical protein
VFTAHISRSVGNVVSSFPIAYAFSPGPLLSFYQITSADVQRSCISVPILQTQSCSELQNTQQTKSDLYQKVALGSPHSTHPFEAQSLCKVRQYCGASIRSYCQYTRCVITQSAFKRLTPPMNPKNGTAHLLPCPHSRAALIAERYPLGYQISLSFLSQSVHFTVIPHRIMGTDRDIGSHVCQPRHYPSPSGS